MAQRDEGRPSHAVSPTFVSGAGGPSFDHNPEGDSFMMPPAITLRHAWTEVVVSDDYDAHMAAIGQAQANAELVPLLLERWPPPGVMS